MCKFAVGPVDTWKFETRISGPVDADPAVLRRYAEEGMPILEASPLAAAVRSDWRERAAKLTPQYNREWARWANVSREDLANSTKRAFDGRTIGLYREQDSLIPIILRHNQDERDNVGGLDVIQVQGGQRTETVLLSQVTDGVPLAWEDPLIQRRDRRRTITVQANPVEGATLPSLRDSVLAAATTVLGVVPLDHSHFVWGDQ